MSVARLRQDRRGSAALVPVFIVLSVLVLASIISALLFTQSVADRTVAQQATASASRSAIAAVTAELNGKPLEQIESERTAAGDAYVPAGWIPTPQQTMHVTAIAAVSPTVVHVTLTVDTPVSQVSAPFTVEYVTTTRLLGPEGWVDVPAGTPDAVDVWVPARTITEAP